MFGAEKRHQLNAGRMEQPFNRRAAKRVKSRVIRDQTNMFSAQRREFFCFQNVEPRLHAPRAALMIYRGLRWRRRTRELGRRKYKFS